MRAGMVNLSGLRPSFWDSKKQARASLGRPVLRCSLRVELREKVV